jgi:hypothetical protein
VVSSARLTAAPAVSPTFSATDAYGDRVYNTGTAAYLAVPVPAAPTGLVAVQVGDQFQVSWKPALVNPAVITSSTLKATSVGSSAPIVTTTVTGTATSGLVGPLQPQTTYQISVVNTDAAGSSPASSPITATTRAASVVPSAPTGVTAHWTAPGYPTDRLLASWQTLPGTTLSASFAVSDIPDWSVTVRAHNSAGWGPWSAVFGLGGI